MEWVVIHNCWGGVGYCRIGIFALQKSIFDVEFGERENPP
jgi:hypothetical protein